MIRSKIRKSVLKLFYVPTTPRNLIYDDNSDEILDAESPKATCSGENAKTLEISEQNSEEKFSNLERKSARGEEVKIISSNSPKLTKRKFLSTSNTSLDEIDELPTSSFEITNASQIEKKFKSGASINLTFEADLEKIDNLKRSQSQITIIRDILNSTQQSESISNVSLITLDGLEHLLKLQEDCSLESIQIKLLTDLIKNLKRDPGFDNLPKILEAEILLLVSSERYKLLDKQLKEIPTSDYQKPDKVGTLRLSNFYFPLRKNLDSKRKKRKYFVLMLSCGVQVEVSKARKIVNDYLEFQDVFIFPNCPLDFKIEVQIFSMSLQNSSKLQSFFSRSTKPISELFKIFDRKQNDDDDSSPIKSSFKLRAKLNISSEDLPKRASWVLDLAPNSPLSETSRFTFKLDELQLKANKSGFLFFKFQLNKSSIATIEKWERFWCVLHGSQFKVYKSAQHAEKNPDSPFLIFNLKYSFYATINHNNEMVFKFVRPSAIGENNLPTLLSKPNFVIVTYLIRANSLKYLKLWKNRINYIVRGLYEWKISFLQNQDWMLQ